jgi:hypothetical protein
MKAYEEEIMRIAYLLAQAVCIKLRLIRKQKNEKKMMVSNPRSEHETEFCDACKAGVCPHL